MPAEPKILAFDEWLALQGDKYDECSECGGTGEVGCKDCAILDCDGPNPDCDGTAKCGECDGTGTGRNQARRDYQQAVRVHRQAWERWNQQARP